MRRKLTGEDFSGGCEGCLEEGRRNSDGHRTRVTAAAALLLWICMLCVKKNPNPGLQKVFIGLHGGGGLPKTISIGAPDSTTTLVSVAYHGGC
jgi:hypothetical protein